MTIGVIIFEFKVNANKIIKILFPFTYFMFYQYSIVARSYCLAFPVLMAICWIYSQRKEKPILYCILLFILMNICSYTFVIACSFYLIDIIEMIEYLMQNRSTLQGKELMKNRDILTLFLIAIEILISFLILLPDEDCSFYGNGGASLWYIIYHATIGGAKSVSNLMLKGSALAIFLLTFLAFVVDKNRKDFLKFLIILLVPVIAENMIITCQIWHIGIITIMMVVAFILSDSINKNPIIIIMLTATCIVQIFWTYSSTKFDIEDNYSGSKDVATFLKGINYEDKTIYGLGFDVTAILPYFDYNIFENQNSEKSFWFWSNNNGYMQDENLLKDEADIYVIASFYKGSYQNLIRELIDKKYTIYNFEGHLYTKTFEKEDKGYFVFIKE